MSRSKGIANHLIPGTLFHPGEYIKDELEARDQSQQELADKMSISKSEMSSIIHGRRDINAKIAVLLEKTLGIDAEIWMNLQIRYDIFLVKKKLNRSIKTSKISSAKKQKFKKLVAAA